MAIDRTTVNSFPALIVRIEWAYTQFKMKKRSERRRHCAPAAVPHRRTESAMASCSKAEPKLFPRADPLPGAQDRQNLISWRRSLLAPTDPVW